MCHLQELYAKYETHGLAVLGFNASDDKKIALVAHDNKKRDLIEWTRWNRELLANHELYATGTTGALLEQALGVPVKKEAVTLPAEHWVPVKSSDQ